MELSDFLNGYICISLYHVVPYAHILYVLQRNLLNVAQRTVVSTKKYFRLKLTPEAKIMPVTKIYFATTKKM